MAGVNNSKHGYMWRVGNGQKINIWNDVWIPNCADRKVITPKGAHLLSKVVALIDPATDNWHENLIMQMFGPIDAHRILAIPLPQHGMNLSLGIS